MEGGLERANGNGTPKFYSSSLANAAGDGAALTGCCNRKDDEESISGLRQNPAHKIDEMK